MTIIIPAAFTGVSDSCCACVCVCVRVCVCDRVQCAPVVRVMDVVSCSQDVHGPDDVCIGAGRLYAVPVSVSLPDTALTWHFTTRPKVP